MIRAFVRNEEDRAGFAPADQADARPEVDGAVKAVVSLGDKDNADARAFRDLIRGLLQRGGVVGGSVGAGAVSFGREVERERVAGAGPEQGYG